MRIDKRSYPYLAEHMEGLLARLEEQRARVVSLTEERDRSYRRGYAAGYATGRRGAEMTIGEVISVTSEAVKNGPLDWRRAADG